MGFEGVTPGGAAMSDDHEEKFAKGGNKDLSDGPVIKRGCTDIICVPLFIAHIVGFWIVTFMGFDTGNPQKLIAGRDYKGDYCGIEKQWNDGQNLEGYDYLIWAMNSTSTFDPIAKELVCSSTGRSVLQTQELTNPTMSNDDFQNYCGFSASNMPNSIQAGVNMASDMASSLTSTIGSTFEKYSDPSNAADIFTGASSQGTRLMAEFTKYFVSVCVKGCGLTQSSATTADQYEYAPDPSTYWGSGPTYKALTIFTMFKNSVKNAPSQFNSLKDQLGKLNFNTWSKSDCPYTDRRFCVPMPGVSFTEMGSFSQCMPKIDSGVTSALGDAGGKALEGIAQLDITESASKTFGNVIGDLVNTLDSTIIVCALSFVLGLVMLVLLRFVLKPVVWLSLLLILLVVAAGGVAIMTRATQCKDSDFLDSAKSMGESSQVIVDGKNPFDAECPGGYSIESQTWRDIIKVCGYIVLGLAAIWLLLVICMSCRIALAININAVAAQFLYMNPHVLFVPIVQSLIAIAWIIIWCYCAAFLLSQVPDDEVPTKGFKTYDEAAKVCIEKFPAGDVWKDTASSACATDQLCFKCMPPRFIFDWRFGYSFFAYLWHNFFMVAVLQCTMAGAVGIWFFTPNDRKGSKAVVCGAVKNALVYHTGSLAFGSLILAIIVWVKWFMNYLAEQAKAQHNKVMEYVFKCLAYCIWCFEKCVKFLNKNAYIQIALLGTNFCKSAWSAFSLILRNAARFAVIIMLSYMVHFIMYVLIVASTVVAGYFILQALHDDVDPIVPCIVYGFIGYLTAKMFMGCFALAVDATLQCFIAAEEMNSTHEFVPDLLKKFVDDNAKAEDEKCCSSCNACCVVL